ncbi:efflux RND transporter periplasmic adaptor subunit [Agaribacterium sp. ZY112]|uniref:efflux RND transporter periplasmic adaptor subunit n=1 Tax=Agaribacterium sp. ZY112 TaxID=3233574 RepID=UPI003524A9D9
MDCATRTIYEFWLKTLTSSHSNLVSAALYLAAEQDEPEENVKLKLIAQSNSFASDQDADKALLLSQNAYSKQRLQIAKKDKEGGLLAKPFNLQEHHYILLLELCTFKREHTTELLKQSQHDLAWLAFAKQLKPAPTSNNTVNTLPTKHIQLSSEWELLANLIREDREAELHLSLCNYLCYFEKAKRVSLALVTGPKLQLKAISNSASFDKTTTQLQLLQATMYECLDKGSNIRKTVGTGPANESELINQSHKQLIRENNLEQVSSYLLKSGNKTLAVLCFEFSHEQQENPNIDSYLAICARLLRLYQKSEYSIWSRLLEASQYKLKQVLGPKNYQLKISAIALILFSIVLFIPGQHQVKAKTYIQSQNKYLLSSPQKGFLDRVYVESGSIVKKGDILGQLSDEDLKLQRKQTLFEIEKLKREYSLALADSLRAESAIVASQVKQSEIKLRLINQKIRRLNIVAPASGTIISPDINQRLGSPVDKGEILFELASGDTYKAQILVNERDIAFIKLGQRLNMKLESLPQQTFPATIKRISPMSEIHEGKNVFSVYAELNKESKKLQPGMSGKSRVDIGEKTNAWLWFRDIWHWFLIRFW